ncbi:hypothetical protein DY000_02005442 [Brassica cretica]|uniref:Uncharacterized protein n=1 Tax=Brassica cretica TaxID=69181 RepID=A0ABQ7BZ93_BRACR|nr:hypothetical protein DY000_02005442 [Brassica cretica]
MYVHIAMSRDYVRGRGLRDVWARDATLIVRAGVQKRLDLRYYLCGRVVLRCLYHGLYLRGRGVQRQIASCLFMLELNFHSGSFITQVSGETDEQE